MNLDVNAAVGSPACTGFLLESEDISWHFCLSHIWLNLSQKLLLPGKSGVQKSPYESLQEKGGKSEIQIMTVLSKHLGRAWSGNAD